MTQSFGDSTFEKMCNIEYGSRVVRKRDGGTIYPVYGGGGETFFLDTFNREDRVVVARFAMSEKCTRRVLGKFALNDSGLTLSPKDPSVLRQDYLDYFVLSRNDQIYECARGTAQKNLDVSLFKELRIVFPKSLETQQEIVEKLDSAFAEIDLLEDHLLRTNEKTSHLFHALLNDAFNSIEMREELSKADANQGVSRKNKSSSEFDRMFTVIPDSKTKVKSSTYLDSGKYAVVDQGKALIAGFTDSSPTVGEDLLPVIVFGDHTRAVKYVDFPFAAGADGTQILKPSPLTEPRYAFYSVLMAVSKIPSKGYARHFGDLKKMHFPIPRLKEQQAIVKKLDSALAEIESFKKQTKIQQDHTNELRQSLLNSAFTLEKAIP